MERYYPQIRRYDSVVALYLPKVSKKSDSVIEPIAITIRDGYGKIISVSGNNDVLTALRRLTRYQWHPDFITQNGIIIETKGQMDATFPRLVQAFKEQHPTLFANYRIGFQNPNSYAPTRRKRITYGDWATSVGIQWCHLQPYGRSHPPYIPESWFSDKPVTRVQSSNDFDVSCFEELDEYEFEE